MVLDDCRLIRYRFNCVVCGDVANYVPYGVDPFCPNVPTHEIEEIKILFVFTPFVDTIWDYFVTHVQHASIYRKVGPREAGGEAGG